MKRYFITLLTGIVISIACLAAFNWLVNPYNVFSAPVIKGFNAYKVEVTNHGRMSKVYEVNRLQPDIVILGSSRALVVPVEPLQNESESAYNLALANGSGYEMYRMFQHANTVHPLSKVIIGIGESFGSSAFTNFVEDRLKVDAENQATNSWRIMAYKDVFTSLFSADALRSSIRTFRKQPELDLDEYFIYDKRRRVANAGGHHQMFQALEHQYIVTYGVNGLKGCEYGQPDPAAIQAAKSPYFEKMMLLAYQQDIQFHIFFSPMHARLYEIYCMTGGMRGIENTKRAIVETVEAVAERLGKTPYPVWDFTGYNSITTETLPELDDTTTIMNWYWEGSHYTRETATLILDKMMGKGANTASDFGVRVNAANIEQQLRTIHEQRKQYQATNSADVNELRNLIN
jgi:hypothetical protein